MSSKYNIRNSKDTKTHIYFQPTENNRLDDIKTILEDDAKFDVYFNSGDSYKKVKEYVDRLISNSEFLCKGLNPDYIVTSFDNADAVIIIGSSMNVLPNGNIFGFALINFDEKHNAIYIDVICSHIGMKGVGEILMNEIEDINKKLSMTDIYLKSVKSAISFYEKYGFTKHDKSCDDMCLMIKSIKSGGKKKTTKRQGSKKKGKKTLPKKKKTAKKYRK